MRRSLFIALVGLILISLLEWSVNNEISYYQSAKQADQNQSALFGGPAVLGLRDGIAWFWQWLHDNHDALLVIFTALLFIVTAYLVKFTRGLLTEARKQFPHFKENVEAAKSAAQAAQVSANAAMRQANAAIAIELPILRILDLKLAEFDRSGIAIEGNDPVPAGDLPGLYKILFCYKNVGRTIATVEQVVVEHKITQFLPERPQYHDAKLVWLPFDIEAQASSWFPWPEMLELSQAERLSITTRTEHLWIYGFVKYADFMGDHHESRFLGLWNGSPEQPQTNGIVFGVGLPQYKTNT